MRTGTKYFNQGFQRRRLTSYSCLYFNDTNLYGNQHQQQLQANHIPATRGSIRLSDAQSNNNKKIIPPKLLHPVLHNVPMHFRFGLNGFLSNVLFSKFFVAVVIVAVVVVTHIIVARKEKL